MPKLLSTIVCCFSVLAAGQVQHQHHPPQSAAEYAGILEDPSRDAWQKPHEVVMELELRESEVVADVGAGTGYFARRFAHHAGKVFAVDIDSKLLEIAAKSAPPNLITILATTDDPKLAEGSVDTIFFCDVLHHIERRQLYYRKLSDALKPGGRIVVVDFHKRPLPVGPPPEMKIGMDEVISELKQAGYRVSRRHDFLPYQYFLEFRKTVKTPR